MGDLLPFSQKKTPLADAIKDIPVNSAQVVVTPDGAAAQVSKDLGKGWSVGAAAQWAKDTGYAVAAVFGWKGK